METITQQQRELFEKVIWEMSSNIEIIEYHLERSYVLDDPLMESFKQRLIGIANAIDERQPQLLDIAL